MRFAIVSSIPGTKLQGSLEELEKKGHLQFAVANVEQYAHQVCLETFGLKRARRPSFFFSLTSSLQRPILREALSRSIASLEVENQELSILLLNAAYHDPRRRVSHAPYDSIWFRELLLDAGHEITTVCTIQDDIYEVQQELIEKKILVRSNADCQDFQKDYEELLFLLSWRSHEFSAAKNIASHLDIGHFLLHKKSLIKTLVGVLTKERQSVYLSHPISQSRRHWVGIPDPEKCPNPNAETGDKFSEEVEDVAFALSEHFNVVEPTCIDELRLHDIVTSGGSWGDYVGHEDFGSVMFPRLSKRWPKIHPERLSADQVQYAGGEFRLSPRAGVVLNAPKHTLEVLIGYQQALREQIRVQITARDYQLTEQCDAVLVYRPHASDCEPGLSGGVGDEIQAKLDQRTFSNSKKPKIFALHPISDERRRRNLAILNAATNVATSGQEALPVGVKDLCGIFFQRGSTEEFAAVLTEYVKTLSYEFELEAVENFIEKAIRDLRIMFKSKPDPSSMHGLAWIDEQAAQQTFVEQLLNGEIFSPTLYHYSRGADPIVKLLDSREVSSDLITQIKESLIG